MIGLVLTAALYRSILHGFLVGAVTALTTRQIERLGVKTSWEDALIAGAIAALTIVITRGLGEGAYDGNRAATGNINGSDVPVASPHTDVTPAP